MPNKTDLITEAAAAECLDVNAQTLATWRCQGRGPKYIRVGRNVRYRVADLDDFLQRNTVTPGSED